LTGGVAAALDARAIAVGAGGAWVTDAPLDGRGLVWRIDPATVTVSGGATKLARAPAGVTTGGGAVWVAGGLDGTVIEIDPASGDVVRSIAVGNAPLDVAFARGEVWAAVAGAAAAT
jgi:streptogramin lyase